MLGLAQELVQIRCARIFILQRLRHSAECVEGDRALWGLPCPKDTRPLDVPDES